MKRVPLAIRGLGISVFTIIGPENENSLNADGENTD